MNNDTTLPVLRHFTEWAIQLFLSTLLLLLFVFSHTGCAPESESQVKIEEGNHVEETILKDAGHPWFKDATKESGIQFINSPKHEIPYFMPDNLGAGAAVIDVNHDGLLDLYCLRMTLMDTGPGNQFFEQQPDGTFLDKTETYGLGLRGYFHGIGVGDLNNDGYDDLVLSAYMGVQVLLNESGKGFKNVTADAGVSNLAWGMSVALTDYDNDGWLDFVIANYLKYVPKPCSGGNGEPDFCGPQNFNGSANRLFRNISHQSDGAAIQFEDVTSASGIGSLSRPSLGVTCLDFTGDGLVDLFFADDMQPNCLFVNKGDGTFAEEGGLRGIAVDGIGQARADMGIGIADVDLNGFLDVFVTHLKGEPHTLWAQGPAGIFTDKTLIAGLTQREWQGTAFGTVMADFDLDGWPDMVMVNGGIRRNDFQRSFVREDVEEFWKPYAQRAQLYRNQGEGRFVEITSHCPDLTGFAEVGRGLLAADFDNDGGLDLLGAPIGSPFRLYKNVASNRGAWLGITAKLPDKGGRIALGADIEVIVGDKVYKAIVNSGYSYLCANDPRVLIGLGQADAVDDIVVTWPDLTRESFENAGVNQYIIIEKGTGKSLDQE